jgi:hypothetical protein
VGGVKLKQAVDLIGKQPGSHLKEPLSIVSYWGKRFPLTALCSSSD